MVSLIRTKKDVYVIATLAVAVLGLLSMYCVCCIYMSADDHVNNTDASQHNHEDLSAHTTLLGYGDPPPSYDVLFGSEEQLPHTALLGKNECHVEVPGYPSPVRVVIVNPDHCAIALEYDSSIMLAPKIVAKGQGHSALKIKNDAIDNNVSIVQNKALVQSLRLSEVDDYIPAAHYKTVVEIIDYVYQTWKKKCESENQDVIQGWLLRRAW